MSASLVKALHAASQPRPDCPKCYGEWDREALLPRHYNLSAHRPCPRDPAADTRHAYPEHQSPARALLVELTFGRRMVHPSRRAP